MSSLALDFETPLPVHRRRVFDWRFLALAVLLHAGLLLLPVFRKGPDVSPVREIELWLQAEPRRETEPLAPEPEPEVVPRLPPQVAEPLPDPVHKQVDALPPTPDQPAPTPDAQAILDSIESLEWHEPPAGVAPIARVQDGTVYERLSKPLLPEIDNLFNGMVLPTKARVVDRWLEPGGVHRVVVRLPNGTMVCGRQEPVNDFRPWEQMPMMFGECGGGGRR